MNTVFTGEFTPDQEVVGIGEIAVATGPESIVTYALGSCIGVAVHDPLSGAGGLLHAALPSSELDPERARREPGRFVDTGLRTLVERVRRLADDGARLVVRAAGGASVSAAHAASDTFEIGRRNVSACREVLDRMGLSMRASHLGGGVSRTVRLSLPEGRMIVEADGEEHPL